MISTSLYPLYAVTYAAVVIYMYKIYMYFFYVLYSYIRYCIYM